MSEQPINLGYMTEDQYLLFESKSSSRHEYVGGFVWAMDGPSLAHELIKTNIIAFLYNHLDDSPCRVLGSNTKVKIAVDNSYYYPDAVVTCESFRPEDNVIEHPTLVVEILSPSTEKFDQREKLSAYTKLKSLLQYIVVHQRQKKVEVYTRHAKDNWQMAVLTGDDDLVFESIPRAPVVMPLSQVYKNYNPPYRVKEDEGSYSPDND